MREARTLGGAGLKRPSLSFSLLLPHPPTPSHLLVRRLVHHAKGARPQGLALGVGVHWREMKREGEQARRLMPMADSSLQSPRRPGRPLSLNAGADWGCTGSRTGTVCVQGACVSVSGAPSPPGAATPERERKKGLQYFLRVLSTSDLSSLAQAVLPFLHHGHAPPPPPPPPPPRSPPHRRQEITQAVRKRFKKK